MPRSTHGGRHELGQNFLTHTPTIKRIASLVAETDGAILELGSGDGALTRALHRLQRPLTAIDIDENRVRRLRRALPEVKIKHADALRHPLDAPVIVGNIPFNITTPVFRRLLSRGTWRSAFLLTQWEVARKRAGIGGGTMMTAQTAPWFTFTLHGRVHAHHFTPRPSVDGGIIAIHRRPRALLAHRRRRDYESFVRSVFTGRGGTIQRVVQQTIGLRRDHAGRVLSEIGVSSRGLPRDLCPEQWVALYERTRFG